MLSRVEDILLRLNVDISYVFSGNCRDTSPVTGEDIASFPISDAADIHRKIQNAREAFCEWRMRSPEERRDLIYAFANEIRAHAEELATLIVIETGKIRADALAEVYQTLTICELAAGMAHRLTGFTAPGEMNDLSVMQTWMPLGVVGIVSSFNFPLRIWAYNAMMALACGDVVIWRPSRKAALTAYVANHLLQAAAGKAVKLCPANISQIVVCNHNDATVLAKSAKIDMLTATGSPVLARNLVSLTAQRLGRSVLLLGGNNAAVVTPSANIDAAVKDIVNSAVLDCGQRSTSLQRLFCHSSVYEKVRDLILKRIDALVIDSPVESTAEVGPMIDNRGYDLMRYAIEQAAAEGAVVHGGERLTVGSYENAYYVRPALIEMKEQTNVMKTDLLAPVLFMMPYDDIEEAVTLTNAFPNTLISCIFSNDLREFNRFTGIKGTTSGVAAVNTGTVNYDMIALSCGEQGGNGFSKDIWQTFMSARTTFLNNKADSLS